jgi:preprotein translocase subunit SecB
MENTDVKQITPKEYNELLKKLDLHDIYLSDVTANLHKSHIGEKVTLNLVEKFRILQRTPELVRIEVDYQMTGKSKQSKVVSVKAKYVVVFQTAEEMPEEFFAVYNTHSLPLQTYPYFRELVNSIVSRMGFPPLVLPLRKFLTDKSD